MAVKESVTKFVTEYVFNFRLQQFLVKYQTFTNMAMKEPVMGSVFIFPSQHFKVRSNVVSTLWINVEIMLKMKQNPTSDFQRCTTLIQRQCPTLKQRRNNVTQRRNNVAQRWYNVDTTLFQPSVDVS